MYEVVVVNKYKERLNELPGVSVSIMQTHGSGVGNPFYKEPREISVPKFTEWFRTELANPHSKASYEIRRLFMLLQEFGRLNLVCVCKPKACHGDVVKNHLDHIVMNKLIRRW